MKPENLTSEFESKKVFQYAADGNKVVKRNRMMRKIAENLYIGETRANEYGQKFFDVYACFDGVECGLKVTTLPGYWLDEEDGLEQIIDRARVHSNIEGILNFVYAAVAKQDHIPMIYVEFVNQIKPEYVPAMLESRRLYSEREERERAEYREKVAAEEAEYCRERNEAAKQNVEKAIEILRNGGILENYDVTFYKSRYDSSTYSIVNYLCRKYGIKLPLRTAGWVNNCLATLKIENGKCEQLQYYKRTKTTKPSEVIYGYINQLIAAVNQQIDIY